VIVVARCRPNRGPLSFSFNTLQTSRNLVLQNHQRRLTSPYPPKEKIIHTPPPVSEKQRSILEHNGRRYFGAYLLQLDWYYHD